MTGPQSTLLLTRPMPQSNAVLVDLETRLGRSVPHLISPVIKIVPVGDLPDLNSAETIVVTSGNAVERLGAALAGRNVITAGQATADRAQSFGAIAVSKGDTAQELRENSSKLKPPILLCRGVHARRDLADALGAKEAIIYDQVACSLSDAAKNLLDGKAPVIAPIYSPRSAVLLSEHAIAAPISVLVISEATAKAWNGPGDIKVARKPTAHDLANLVIDAL